MDTTPSPRSSSQDVTMEESETHDSGPTGYSQADYAASQAVGDRSSSDDEVEVSDADRFTQSTVDGRQYEVWVMKDFVTVYLPDRIDDAAVVFEAKWPKDIERSKMIAAMSQRTVILTLSLSHLFDFIHSKCAFPGLLRLMLWVNDPCEHQLKSLPDHPPKFAPALERLDIQKDQNPLSTKTPEDVTKWAVEHGVPLIVILYKRLTCPSLNIIFRHTTSGLREGETRGVTPIKEALEKEGIPCSLKVINIRYGSHTEETCNLMEIGFAS